MDVRLISVGSSNVRLPTEIVAPLRSGGSQQSLSQSQTALRLENKTL